MLRRRTAWMLAVPSVMLVASMGLTGCGPDNPAPKPFNPPKAPSVSGSVLSDSPPTMPEAAKQNNAAGAKAFVRYYFEVVSYAQVTGNLTQLEALARPGCESCEGFVETVRTTYEAGGKFEGRGAEASDLRSTTRNKGSLTLLGRIKLFHQVDYRSQGAKPETHPKELHNLRIDITREGQEWRVVEWGFES